MTDSPNAGGPMLRSPSRATGPPGESVERMVRANKVELRVQAFGHAGDPVILLIRGSAASMDWWEDDFCERLAAGRRFVIRYDHRDTGRSASYQPGAPPCTLRDLAADAVDLLDAFGVARAHLVGMSMGGAIAQLMALDHPGRVASLTLIATSMTNHDVMDGDDRWRERLGELRAPTLVVHGTDDPVLPYSHGLALAKEIPGAHLLPLEQTGHELPRAVWDVVVPVILWHTSPD
jgi:pimeloyl-ACP methyl ester carboxylesterase